MDGIIPQLSAGAKEHLQRQMRDCRDADSKTRYLIVLNLLDGVSPAQVARTCRVSRSSVYRVAERFREAGEAGLIDRREDNGCRKLDERYLATLYEVVSLSPQTLGWRRPTWTRELLVETLAQLTGVRIHVSRMSVALKQIGARRGRPKPTVACPWSPQAKQRRIREIQRLIEALPADEVAFYEDEVDLHLNPKIGLDWMVPRQQKEVRTPGQNQKRYLAGAQDVRTGELLWVEFTQKNSTLFLMLLWHLLKRYPHAKKIHLILDNYSIHTSRQVDITRHTPEGQRLEFHFLPPYCPDHNRIERTWQDLHASVTRNHTCTTMDELMQNVNAYLAERNRHKQHSHTAAA